MSSALLVCIAFLHYTRCPCSFAFCCSVIPLRDAEKFASLNYVVSSDGMEYFLFFPRSLG